MLISREKYVQHIYLIVLILIQIIGFQTVQGLKCVQCGVNGTDCPDDLSVKPTDCPTGTFNKCFTKINEKGKIERGCEIPAEESNCSTANKCELTDEGNNGQLVCKTCSGADCSNIDVTDIKYSAICGAGMNKCIKQLKDNTIERKCATDAEVSTSCTDKNTCQACASVNCNTGTFPEVFTCIRCRSDINAKCWNNATGVVGQTCRTEGANADQGCFHGIWNGVAIRGCVIDASKRDQALCQEKNNPNRCTICNKKDCNIEKSAGAKSALSLALMSLVLIPLTLWNFK